MHALVLRLLQKSMYETTVALHEAQATKVTDGSSYHAGDTCDGLEEENALVFVSHRRHTSSVQDRLTWSH